MPSIASMIQYSLCPLAEAFHVKHDEAPKKSTLKVMQFTTWSLQTTQNGRQIPLENENARDRVMIFILLKKMWTFIAVPCPTYSIIMNTA